MWILVVIVAAVVALFAVYNRLVQLKNRASEAWSDIDVQLKRRHNLIPNLVETVKGYATHERSTLDSVTKARVGAMQAEDPKAKAAAENMLSSTLKTLFAVSESYPDLKANANFLELQRELSDTEDKVLAARRFYNTSVRDLNTAIESVPTNVVAGMFSFKKREFFELDDEAAKAVPKVDFSQT